MNQSMKLGLVGRFKLEAHKLDGTSRVVADWFDNLILDSGLNRMGTEGNLAQGAMVGSGSNAPLASQASLTSQVAFTTTRQSQLSGSDVTNGFMWLRRTYRFAAGQAAGNLSEVGVGWESGACFSRALIQDSNANPTTVTILSDEFLDVTYELRVFWPTTDVAGTLTLNSINYNYTLRPALVNQWHLNVMGAIVNQGFSSVGSFIAVSQTFSDPSSLGALTGLPSGSPSGNGALALNGSYSNGSYQRNMQMAFSLDSVTVPIRAVYFAGNFAYWQARFDPVIPKTASNQLTIDFRINWARR